MSKLDIALECISGFTAGVISAIVMTILSSLAVASNYKVDWENIDAIINDLSETLIIVCLIFVASTVLLLKRRGLT